MELGYMKVFRVKRNTGRHDRDGDKEKEDERKMEEQR
jgi:hypothetical protein